MIDITDPSFLSGAVVGALSLLAAYGGTQRRRSRRRASELRAAALALTAHYDAMDSIVDDPALPLGALEMLTNFSEGIASEEFCKAFTDAAMTPPEPDEKDRVPPWFAEVEALRKTRPELAADIFKAISAGLAAAFLRWPGNSWKIPHMVAAMSLGDRKEAVLAERVSEMNRSRHRDDASPPGSIPIPA